MSVEKDLEAGVKVLDSAELDFSRYADTLFEVLFAGGRLSTGGNLADDQKEKLAFNVSCYSSRLLHKQVDIINPQSLTLFVCLLCAGAGLRCHARGAAALHQGLPVADQVCSSVQRVQLRHQTAAAVNSQTPADWWLLGVQQTASYI